jgi:hypothetical protein
VAATDKLMLGFEVRFITAPPFLIASSSKLWPVS